MLFKKKIYQLPYMETHLVDHCNLKCDHCGHYCHIVDEEIFTDINQFKQDMKELASKVRFYTIRLMGGEPLLHPQINDFLIITRKLFPYTNIRIVTNGILLPAMKDNFWNTVNTLRIGIDLSKYPILGNKFSELLDLIDDKRAILGNINLAKKFYDKLNVEGNCDIKKSFNACYSRNALNLWKQKLYTCQACYRYYYNKKYGTNIILPDAVDIYKASGKEIFQKMNKPNEGCRFCNEISKEYTWSQYKPENNN